MLELEALPVHCQNVLDSKSNKLISIVTNCFQLFTGQPSVDSQSRFERGSIFEDDGAPSDDELFGNEDDWLSEDFKDMDQNVRLRTDIHAYCVCDKKSLAIEKFFFKFNMSYLFII